jgi:hypothetical protein
MFLHVEKVLALKRAVDIFEMAADKSHHHVTHTKLRRGMPRFEKPFGHYPLLSSRDIIWTGFTLNARRAGFNFSAAEDWSMSAGSTLIGYQC